MITYNDIKHNEAINTYIKKADESLKALGYTEHSFAHVGLVSSAPNIFFPPWDILPRKLSLPKLPHICTTLATL